METFNHFQPITNCYLDNFKSIGSKDNKRKNIRDSKNLKSIGSKYHKRNKNLQPKPTKDIKEHQKLEETRNFSKDNLY